MILPGSGACLPITRDPGKWSAAVPGAFRPGVRPSVDPDRDVSAVDAVELPVPDGVRDAVPLGHRVDHLAAVLPDRSRGLGAAFDHVD